MTGSADSIKRILVALNPAARDLEALEQAAEMAARIRGHLMALLVEDIHLFDLARLPFARELDRASGSARPLDSGAVARAMRADAERIGRALRAAAETRRISAELKVVRGDYIAAAIEAAVDCNFVFLSDVMAVTSSPAGTRSPVPPRKPRPVWVYFDASPASERALTMAASLCRERGARLMIVLPPDADLDTGQSRIEALIGTDIAADYQRLPDPAAPPTTGAQTVRDCALFLVPRSMQDVAGDAARFLKGLRCPLVLVA